MADADVPSFAFRLPDGHTRDEARLTFSNKMAVEISARLGDDPDADPIIVPLGRGWNALFVQARQCGDYYVELEGGVHVSGIGATNVAALRAALDAAREARAIVNRTEASL